MITIRRLFIGFFLILFALSIHHDLSKVSLTQSDAYIEQEIGPEQNFTIIRKKVLPGDTVLSMIDLINEGSLEQMNTQKLLDDFNELNPTVNHFNIQIGSYYYFPKYEF